MRIGESWFPVFWNFRFVVARLGFDEDTDPRVSAARLHGPDVWVGRYRAKTEDDELDETELFILVSLQPAVLGTDYNILALH